MLAVLFLGGCARKRPQAPPPPPPVKQNVVVLLPEPDGKPSRIAVTNSAGTRDLDQPYQAVTVQRADAAPSTPFVMTQAEVRRLFGAALDVLPPTEVQFVLYFQEGRDTLIPESEAQLPAIITAIQERHSTAITVTGHTDTTADPQFNYELGLRRAQTVARILTGKGVAASDVFVASHGQADLLVKTPNGVAEQRNRRVEVIVR
ncbi:OmpA family protein [uncultured Paludibaculum sp.]|uniref:OmpA family protein n=1 Tax=uncultured Paludibaculum sp. TaxID=1765020 RepID=UPI002AABFC1E|nr:OmpA family protein [uncultured Paludibaculum sp.]